MWYTFSAFGEFTVYLNRGSQPFADKAQCDRTFYLAVQQLQQNTVIYFVEEVLQVYVNNVLITGIDVFLCLEYSLLGVAVGTKTEGVILKFNLEFNGYYLSDCLLQKTVSNRWNTQ